MYKQSLLMLAMLSTPLVASAGGAKAPYDLSTPEETLKSAKKMSYKVAGNAKSYPKKVAIGYFQVRYQFRDVSADKKSTTITTLKFTDADYTRLTDQLYAQLENRLVAEGFEVVPQDTLVDSAAYQAIEGEDNVAGNAKRVRYSPTGMKNLPTFSGRPKKPGSLVSLNRELGSDAVVAAFVNVGICPMEPTKKNGFKSGVYPCIKGDLTMPGFNISWIGGSDDSGKKVKPDWTARLYQELNLEAKAGKITGHGNALVGPRSGTNYVKQGFWKGRGLEANETAFVGGAGVIYDDNLAMAFEMWESKYGGKRKSAGLSRGPVDGALKAAPEAVATTKNQTFPVPTLPGTEVCYYGTQAPGELLLRRGVDAEGGQIVEEVVTFLKGQSNYRAGSRWTFDGQSATLADAAGGWEGTATFQDDPWTAKAWTLELKFNNGMQIHADYQQSDTGLTSTSQIEMNGAPAGEVQADLKLISNEECHEKLLKVKMPPAL